MKEQRKQRLQSIIKGCMPSIDTLVDMRDALCGVARAAEDVFAPDVAGVIARNPATGCWIREAQMCSAEPAVDRVPLEEAIAPALIELVLHSSRAVMMDLTDEEESYQSTYTRKHAIRTVVAWTMSIDDESMCIAFLYFREHYRPTRHQRRDIAYFIEQATPVLHEYWLQWPYRVIERIEQSINRTVHDAQSLYHVLLPYVTDVFGSDYTFLLAVYPRQGNLIDIWVNEGQQVIEQRNGSLDGDACQYVIETGQTLFIDRLSAGAADASYYIRHIEQTSPRESFIFVPLVLRDDTFGVLSIQHPEPHALSKNALPMIKLLANYVVLVLRNMSLYDSLEKLNTTGYALTQLLESGQLLKSTTEKIREDAQADVVVLYLFDTIRQTFVLSPYIGGSLQASKVESMMPRRKDDIVNLMLQQHNIIFAKDSSTLYEEHLHGNIHSRQGDFELREQVQSTVAATLRLQDEIVGVIFLNFRKKQRFDEAQKLFISALTNYAAISIKFARVFGVFAERHTRQQEVLKRIEEEVSHSLDLSHVLDTILQESNKLINADGAAIFLYNRTNNALEVKAATGHIAEPLKSLSIPLNGSKSIVRYVFMKMEPVNISNIYDDNWSDIYMPSLDTTDSRSELDAPLLEDGECLGVLNFESKREGAFSNEDMQFLILLASHVLLAVKRAQDYSYQKRAAEESYSLSIVSREIIGQLDSQVVFQLILDQALRLMNAALGSLHIYDTKTRELVMKAEVGADRDKRTVHQTFEQGIVGYVAKTLQTVNADLTLTKWQAIYVPFAKGIQSELTVPMLAINHVLRGVLNVESRNVRHFTVEDEKLLEKFADLAVVALEHAEHYQQALREKKKFELLFQVAQELGRLSIIEQLPEASALTCRLASEYGTGPVQFVRTKEQAVHQSRTETAHHIPVRSNGTLYGYLLVYSDAETPISSGVLDVEKSLFLGLAQLLASTIDRLQTTYREQEAEKEALSHERMAWVGSLLYAFPHDHGTSFELVPSYVNDVVYALEQLGVEDEYVRKKLLLITSAVQKQLELNAKIVQLVHTSAHITMEEVHPRMLFEMACNIIDTESHNIVIDMNDRLPVSLVKAIPEVAMHILKNVIINAIDAMPDGGTITLSAFDNGDFVALEVSDTGEGIPQEIRKAIFNLGKTTKDSSGFGLWAGQFTAQHMKGKLELVSSEQGIGTTFRLNLLRVEPQAVDAKSVLVMHYGNAEGEKGI